MVKKSIVERFMKEHGLLAADVNTEQLLAAFRSEMEKGLAGQKSSLEMIPAFVTTDRDVPASEPVIVMDAGGTNLRVATIVFDDEGKAKISDIKRHQMPGIEKELTADEFFGKFAEYVAPVIGESDRIGFCFSYPAEITPELDGRLLLWSKEVKAPEVVGRYIGQGLLSALGDAGTGKKAAILNDTIATLLAGRAVCSGKQYDSYIGFILGTGTNMAYIEKNSNITKRKDLDASGSQAINVESGGFGKTPRGDLDIAIDESTANPGRHTFEKMISGRYMSELMLLALKTAAKTGMFSDACTELINGIDKLSGKDVDMFLLDKKDSPLVSDAVSKDDEAMIKEMLHGIYDRAAKFTAINISAGVLKSGGGTEHPVCINIDGSTYYKAVGFKDKTEGYLADILGSRGLKYELTHADEAPMMGAAIAGLTS